MRFPGFVGPSYTLSSVDYDYQRSINLYPEIDEIHTGKEGEVAALIGTPGLALLAAIGNGPIRGIYYSNPALNGNTNTGILFVVSGNTVYTVTSAWVATSIGTLQTSTGPVSMVDNKIQLMIVDGPNGYYVPLLTPTSVTQIVSANWSGSNTVTYQDGYFIFNTPNANQFYLSDLNAITFTAPATTGTSGGDNLLGVISANKNLWLIGDRFTEVWFDSGNNLNPFQYIQGTRAQVGITSPYSLVAIANTVAWLGKDSTGTGIVFLANGYTPTRISTHAVEYAIQQYSTISDAIAYTYEENGHIFYVLTFPTASTTWVYDTTTQMWHERAYLSQGVFQRHRSNCHAFAFGTDIVGDYSNGNLYNMSSTVYSDNGAALIRQRIAPHFSKSMNRIIHHELTLDMQSGIGLDGTGQGTNPVAMLQWSNDGGHTWSNEHTAPMCAIGQTVSRCIWRRLGNSRNRVYKMSISDPVKVFIMGAEIELEVCAS